MPRKAELHVAVDRLDIHLDVLDNQDGQPSKTQIAALRRLSRTVAVLFYRNQNEE